MCKVTIRSASSTWHGIAEPREGCERLAFWPKCLLSARNCLIVEPVRIQGFIQDFAFGGGPGSNGTFFIGELKNFAFFQNRKFSKIV